MRIMRTEEILWLYELGERNFKRQNLRGKSFRGEDLSGVDFSGSDIRGADFTNAILRGTNFTNVIAGLQKRQAIALVIILLSLAVVLGVVTGGVDILSQLQTPVLPADSESTFLFWLTPLLLLAFCLVSLNQGMAIGFCVFIGGFVLAGFVGLVSPAGVPFSGKMALLITVTSLVTATTASLGALTLAAILAFRRTVAVTMVLGFVLAFGITLGVAHTLVQTSVQASTIATLVTVLLLSLYIDWRAMHGDRRHLLTWMVASLIATHWGTSFRNADLTHANFSRATLRSTNFRGALLLNTQWGETVGVIPVRL
ncbi:MAG: pentapeptide repeat-containing protein [Synechococcales cyanobacterium M58_A2018_015]|nr:pentapeptide repeat-containing protein [Synechococcales cyanobacterium M58_A2018_015]